MSNYHFYKNNNSNKNLNIDKDEVLRYLGYKNNVIDETTDSIIDSSIYEIQKTSSMNYVYAIFNIEETNEGILLNNSIIKLTGRDIHEHLKGSQKVAVMAVTLGFQVEQKIKHYSITNLTKGIILDACATAMVEELCNYVEKDIKALAIKSGYNITHRYSPGYGDLPISIQPDILNALNAQRLIGLTVTDNFILLPRKSVTAIIGFTKEKPRNKEGCLNCNLYENCQFSKERGLCHAK
ncbi:MAG: methionine synthase [Tissierellia bacterium]|nr:methionine synthase [Tissierellia bacterium]